MDRFKIISALLVLLFVIIPGFAEAADHVFLKNGIILEGRVVDETDIGLTILLKTAKSRLCQEQYAETLYNDNYKVKHFIQLKNGDIIEGISWRGPRFVYAAQGPRLRQRIRLCQVPGRGSYEKKARPVNVRPETPRGSLPRTGSSCP